MMKLNIQLFAENEIVVETRIDTTGFDKGVKEIESKDIKDKVVTIKGESKELSLGEKLKEKIEDAVSSGQDMLNGLGKTAKATLQEIGDYIDSISEKATKVSTPDFQPTDTRNLYEYLLDNDDYDTSYLAQIENQYHKIIDLQEEIDNTKEPEVRREINVLLEQAVSKMDNLLDKQWDLDHATEDTGDKQEENNTKLEKHNNTLGNIIKKVGKWALAIVGIRSVYSGIRRAISMVSAQSESVANQMKVMTTAVANALTPLVSKIMNIIAQIMMYIDYIYFRLTSKHLFDFSKAFADANKSAKGTAKSVGKMTASFDEMNVLQNNSSGGGGGGVPATDNPFKDWENFKAPKWLETIANILDWIKKNWQAVLIGILAIGAGFLLWKAFSGGENDPSKALINISEGFKTLLESLGTAIVVIAILGSFALVVKEIANLLDVFAKSGLEVGEVLGLLGTIVASLTILIVALTIASQALQSPMAMAGLAVLTASICTILLVVAKTLPTILDALGKFLQAVAPVLIKVLDTIGTNIEKIIYALGTTLPPIINSVGRLFNTIFNGISKVVSTVGNTIVSILKEAGNLTDKVLSGILRFIRELGPAINVFVDNAIKAVTKLINFIVSGIEYLINTLIINAVNKIIDSINSVGDNVGFTIPRVKMMTIPRFRPQLAKGGIVNMPGKGVPVGGAIAGERGPEAVLPLTDSQQMALLGEAIGKYITINANITNTMNGRVISRELQKVQNEQDFAYNR